MIRRNSLSVLMIRRHCLNSNTAKYKYKILIYVFIIFHLFLMSQYKFNWNSISVESCQFVLRVSLSQNPPSVGNLFCHLFFCSKPTVFVHLVLKFSFLVHHKTLHSIFAKFRQLSGREGVGEIRHIVFLISHILRFLVFDPVSIYILR
jgi:hypothetical protein